MYISYLDHPESGSWREGVGPGPSQREVPWSQLLGWSKTDSSIDGKKAYSGERGKRGERERDVEGKRSKKRGERSVEKRG